MQLKYKCTSGSCRKKSKQKHQLVIPDGMVMDDKNVAVMFCPNCKGELKKIKFK